MDILVVDDVPEIVEFCASVVRHLRRADVAVTTSSDARAALDLVKAHSYRAIITDFRMPFVTGLEILAAARARDASGRRVLMTGYNEIPASDEAITSASPDAYLQKPIPAQGLLLLLRDLLSDDPLVLQALRADARKREEAAAEQAASEGTPAAGSPRA